ncbi:hypothetical protein [Muribaculum intestinale]|nr:hypothetical protein [Muribaculum intestinale]
MPYLKFIVVNAADRCRAHRQSVKRLQSYEKNVDGTHIYAGDTTIVEID